MRNLVILSCGLILWTVAAKAHDISRMEHIGAIVSFTKVVHTVTFNCQDHSQVQLSVLSPDLLRVGASFAAPISNKAHSWAIAKEKWETTPWHLAETPEAITITTAEVEAVITRSPLLISFR